MATEDRTYNGWKNYETWCVNLWLTNDEATDKRWRRAARMAARNAEKVKREHTSWTLRQCARFPLADALKASLEESRPTPRRGEMSGLWVDLIGSALAEVEWADIADGFLEGEEDYESLPKEDGDA